ncbi:MAG: uroporphyrinogen-III C-methyltransferase [Desulfobaccales bacterium]|jgi:uroporphyrinogen III methyltransferase/synthase
MVYLVGAGPGDPGLITAKGLAVLRRAQVVVYDQLASPELLQEAPAEAEIINAGKQAGAHTLPQERINEILVARARAGLTVVRLKGGDPFVFGRGGEEAEELAKAGIPFEIVPGVTAAVAVPAYAGIPVTHRRYTTLVTLITGHEDPNKEASAIPWEALGQNPGTLVFLMGVKNLPEICRQLVAKGRDPRTPAALIEKGATLAQRTVTGTLTDLAQKAREAAIQPPAILVVGEVVELRQRLQWWETRPLWGKTVVVTRSRQQASKLVALLAAAGARCLEVPTLEIGPPDDFAPLDEALRRLDQFHWLVFTSANGVAAFMARLFGQGKDVRVLGQAKIAAIGPATAQALEGFGLKADVVPSAFTAEVLLQALSPLVAPGSRILLARAQIAREVLPQGLVRLAAEEVKVAPVYKTRTPREIPPEAEAALKEGPVDVLTFTSSATVHNFARLLGKERFQVLAATATLAAIGPITAATLGEYGLSPQIEPADYTIPALALAIIDYYSKIGPQM